MNLMKFISLFESVTRTSLKDAFELGDMIYFVVQPGLIGKAVGKKGANYRKLEGILKKKIKMIEYAPNLDKFVANVVFPLKVADVEVTPDKVFITAADVKTRGMLIGRGGGGLRVIESVVKRYFDIEEVRVN